MLDIVAAISPATGVPRDGWNLAELRGRLCEISTLGAGAAMTLALSLAHRVQLEGEPVAWVGPTDSCFYPPDAARGGIDLETLVVVRVPKSSAIPRAADKLLRSGAFALVILDLGASAQIPMPLQSRLLGLTQKHDATLLCLTQKNAGVPSLGSLFSLRLHAQRQRKGEDQFACSLIALKDKRKSPNWKHHEVCSGPMGLR